MQNNNPSILPPRDPADWPKWVAELAKAGAKLGNCGKMCKDCAFKHPQPKTEDYTQAVDDAVFQIAWGGGFHCHTDDKQDAGCDCVGFKYANLYLTHHADK